MKAIVLIKFNTGDLKDAFNDLKRLRSVTEAHLTFGPYDAIAIVQADNLKSLGQIVAREIQLIPGLVETCTCLMVDSDVLESIQVAEYPGREVSPEMLDIPRRNATKNPFARN
jgi:DNA-binding Lrp family transcriptional regulator